MSLPDIAGSRVVLAGTATYRHGDYPPLPAVRNNLADLKTALTDHRLWGIPVANVRVVSDPQQTSEITEQLRQAAREATDTLIFYYAGHGFLSEKIPALYLTGRDSRKHSGSSALEYRYIREEVLESRARRKIVILDCCYSGNAHVVMSGDAALQDIKGAYVLTSSRRNEASTAPAEARHTAFTGALLEVLTSGVEYLKDREFLTVDEIFREVRAELARSGFGEPDRRDHGTVGDLTLVYNRAHQEAPRVPLTPPPAPRPPDRQAPSRRLAPRLWHPGPAVVSVLLGAAGGGVVAVAAGGVAGAVAGLTGAVLCYVTTALAGDR
ncbi:hypothetical protein Acy02nite_47250 [Actinoplanes cyaneus]|uniref:Peptidase C14 caspase domain-containing protein n=1 Tax=Actinoplanes cyaneus TaxID=52696 RepID=A0A919M8U8_9ACTN|nr:caspase family protein [Actinoplanes cyaneus]MCW2138822.1 Caspase domain-containing protein [Actinoplanes cyaneus]GID66844.1 hypothetical protein Acy02nite_47250 [Actinoplanes cyaneus]